MGKLSLFCFCIVLAIEFAKVSVQEKIEFYELKNGNTSLNLTNWGTSLVSFIIPDKTEKPIDIVLGYDTSQKYQNDNTYMRATVGHVANRIGRAQFKLNGELHKLIANEGKIMYNGGSKGFSKVIWKVEKHQNEGAEPFISFSYQSPNGEEGGHSSGDILGERLQILEKSYTPVNDELIPMGQIQSVSGTPYDFTSPELNPIEKRIKELPKDYDINYVLDGYVTPNATPRRVALVEDSKSGLKMKVLTDSPGLQFYSKKLLEDIKGKGGFVYQAHAGLCLVAQWFPDYVNYPDFPQSIVKEGNVYSYGTHYTFLTI